MLQLIIVGLLLQVTGTASQAHSSQCTKPIVNCLQAPCTVAPTCSRYVQAACKDDYCGGCNALFYYNGIRVYCDRREELAMIAETIDSHGRAFIPAGTTYEVQLLLQFYSPAMEFQVCCKTYEFPGKTVVPDPLISATVTPFEARSVPTIEFDPVESDTMDGKQYTLLLVDPDIPVQYDRNPIVHWMLVNMTGADIRSAVTVLEYSFPKPPDAPHNNYFLLYEQTTGGINVEPTQYGSECDGRCKFQVKKFVSEKGLKLVGGTWISAPPSPYIKYYWSENGRNMSDLCRGEQGYKSPCDGDLYAGSGNGGSDSLNGNIPQLISSLFFMIVAIFCNL